MIKEAPRKRPHLLFTIITPIILLLLLIRFSSFIDPLAVFLLFTHHHTYHFLTIIDSIVLSSFIDPLAVYLLVNLLSIQGF